MKRLLSIFSFKFPQSFFLFSISTLFFAILFDKLIFTIFLPLYDLPFGVGSALQENDIYVVGSSITEYAINKTYLESLTKMSVGKSAVISSSIIPHYFQIEARLSQRELSLPKVIVLEGGYNLFNSTLYRDSVTEPYYPFYHKGLFQEFFDLPETAKLHDGKWRRLISSYSLGNLFAEIFLPDLTYRFRNAYSLLTELEKQQTAIFNAERSLKDYFLLVQKNKNINAKVDSWRNSIVKQGYKYDLDKKFRSYFTRTMLRIRENRVPLIIISYPYYFSPSEMRAGNVEEAISIQKKEVDECVHFLSVSIPTCTEIYSDPLHVNAYSESYITKALSEYILKEDSVLKTCK